MQNDDTQPATKGDLRDFATKNDLLVFATKSDLRTSMQVLSYDIRALNEAVDRVLTVVVNVDKTLKEQIKDHENRIVTLERKVG